MQVERDFQLVRHEADGDITLRIGKKMWRKLLSVGWRIGDDIAVESEPGRIELINTSVEKRLDLRSS